MIAPGSDKNDNKNVCYLQYKKWRKKTFSTLAASRSSLSSGLSGKASRKIFLNSFQFESGRLFNFLKMGISQVQHLQLQGNQKKRHNCDIPDPDIKVCPGTIEPFNLSFSDRHDGRHFHLGFHLAIRAPRHQLGVVVRHNLHKKWSKGINSQKNVFKLTSLERKAVFLEM